MTSWPPGYRSAVDVAGSPWLKVEIGRIIVITGIATQGYGDTSVTEWVSSFILLYSESEDEPFSQFRDKDGDLQVKHINFIYISLYLQLAYGHNKYFAYLE